MNRRNRPALNLLLEKENLIGIEIGVHGGNNAVWMLENLDIEKLYLIEPYETYPSNNPDQTPSGPFPQAKEEAGKQLEPHKDKIKRIFKCSWDAIDHIPDGSLDFVYIDGDHREVAVSKDLKYYRKLKLGGLLCGHDWRFPSVKTAVDKFIADMRIPTSCCGTKQHITAINRSADGCDWWIWMPKEGKIFNQKCELCQKSIAIKAERINWLVR